MPQRLHPLQRRDSRTYGCARLGERAACDSRQGRAEQQATTAILVGHNPDVEDLVEVLTGEWVSLPTSALAVLDITGPWAEVGSGTAVLRASGRPPEGV